MSTKIIHSFLYYQSFFLISSFSSTSHSFPTSLTATSTFFHKSSSMSMTPPHSTNFFSFFIIHFHNPPNLHQIPLLHKPCLFLFLQLSLLEVVQNYLFDRIFYILQEIFLHRLFFHIHIPTQI